MTVAAFNLTPVQKWYQAFYFGVSCARGPVQAAWLWTWKDSIDRAWMAKYGEDLNFDSMPGSMGSARTEVDMVAATAGPAAIQALTAAKMRCGGCGAKVRIPARVSQSQVMTASIVSETCARMWVQVGSDVLTRVLTRLQQDDCAAADSGGVVIGLGDSQTEI